MARPPKPTAQLKTEGTYRADRHDSRGDELQPPGQVIEIDFADDIHAQFCWDLLLPIAELAGCGEVDTLALAGAAKWYSQYRAAMARMEEQPVDGVTYGQCQRAAKTSWSAFLEVARGYGLSPQDRIKLAKPVQKEEELDPFEALQAGVN